MNPTLAQSHPLGGGDADLIVDGTLWDYKASGTTRIIGRMEIWQLLAYLLSDTDDRYRLDAVGISAVRWRTRHAWPVHELLPVASRQDVSVDDLPQWRNRFATAAASAASSGSRRTVRANPDPPADESLSMAGLDQRHPAGGQGPSQ